MLISDLLARNAHLYPDEIDYRNGIKAKLRIHVQTPEGPREKTVTVKHTLASMGEVAKHATGERG